MEWIALSYSLPSKEGSSPRVALWRRLRRLGALPIAGGVQVLPARGECVESFQWLVQEIQATNGEAAVMTVTRLDGVTDQQMVALFCAARAEDYRHLETQALDLKHAIDGEKDIDSLEIRDKLERLRRRHTDIARIDYFDCPEGRRVASVIDGIERDVFPPAPVIAYLPRTDVAAYEQCIWVTRPRPYVDRLACAWLIRRFINPKATIRYSGDPGQDEVQFDMDRGEFGHRGNLCTFETMRLAFGLDDRAMRAIGEIVHEIDLQDARYAWSEIVGIEAVLKGWSQAGLSDGELETRGMSLFEGLYIAFSRRP